MAEKVVQLDRLNGDVVSVFTTDELVAIVERCIREKIARNELCGGDCGDACTVDTRISQQRKGNLMRKGTDLFTFNTQMPLTPGQVKSWTVPKYSMGRVIENLYFRPTMADGGNVDEITVELVGDDGVQWAIFAGGRHASQACCLLEFFQNDCIGYDETFTFRLTHTGAIGRPNMISASADWNYLFPGTRPWREKCKGICTR